MARFELGRTVMTRGIADRLENNKKFKDFVYESLQKYMDADWGDTCEEDAKQNDEALVDLDVRILAVYTDPETKITIWIITEWDHSVTTILFPEEY